MFHKIVAIVVISIIAVGCATVNTLNNATTRSPKVFSGTRLDLYKLQDRKLAIERFNFTAPKYPLLDLPVSFLADIFVFPMTSSAALYETVFK